jgi:hypothetical protein
MSQILFKHKELTSTVDTYVSTTGDMVFSMVWEYVKKMVEAQAKFLRHDETSAEAKSRCWFSFEQACSHDLEDINDPFDFALEALYRSYTVAAPVWGESNFWMEVGFGKARGRTEKEAMADQYESLSLDGGYEAVYECKDPRAKRTTKRKTTKRKPRLKVMKGGKR